MMMQHAVYTSDPDRKHLITAVNRMFGGRDAKHKANGWKLVAQLLDQPDYPQRVAGTHSAMAAIQSAQWETGMELSGYKRVRAGGCFVQLLRKSMSKINDVTALLRWREHRREQHPYQTSMGRRDIDGCQPPGTDHDAGWKKAGKLVMFTSEPYSLHMDELADMIAFAKKNGLDFHIDAEGGWYPSRTMCVTWTVDRRLLI